MPSTYTNLGIELMADGENANTWGQKTNVNLEMIEEALAGIAVISITGSTSVPSFSNGTSGSNARKGFLRFEGSLSGSATITLPTKDKIYGVENATSGSQSIVLSCGSGANVTIPNGKSAMIHTSVSGQNVRNLSNPDVSTDPSVANAVAKIPSSWTSSAQSIFGLTDVTGGFLPTSAGKILKVNAGATAFELADDDAGSGSGGDAATLNGNNGAHYLNYNNFTNTPTIPTNNNQLINGANYVTSSGWTSMSSFVSGGGATYGGVGTYIFATVNDTANYTPGQSSISGSSLRPSGAVRINSSGNSGPTAEIGSSGPSGTWRCMGNRVASNTGWSNATYVATLFVRTS